MPPRKKKAAWNSKKKVIWNNSDCKANECLRPPGTSNWVCCDNCRQWFHVVCLNVKLEEIVPDKDFYCQPCQSSKEEEYLKIKERLFEKVSELADAQTEFSELTISRDMFRDKKRCKDYNFSQNFPPTLRELLSRIRNSYTTVGEMRHEYKQMAKMMREHLLEDHHSSVQYIEWELDDIVKEAVEGDADKVNPEGDDAEESDKNAGEAEEQNQQQQQQQHDVSLMTCSHCDVKFSSPSIYTCLRGHKVCANCQKLLFGCYCPTCKYELGERRRLNEDKSLAIIFRLANSTDEEVGNCPPADLFPPKRRRTQAKKPRPAAAPAEPPTAMTEPPAAITEPPTAATAADPPKILNVWSVHENDPPREEGADVVIGAPLQVGLTLNLNPLERPPAEAAVVKTEPPDSQPLAAAAARKPIKQEEPPTHLGDPGEHMMPNQEVMEQAPDGLVHLSDDGTIVYQPPAVLVKGEYVDQSHEVHPQLCQPSSRAAMEPAHQNNVASNSGVAEYILPGDESQQLDWREAAAIKGIKADYEKGGCACIEMQAATELFVGRLELFRLDGCTAQTITWFSFLAVFSPGNGPEVFKFQIGRAGDRFYMRAFTVLREFLGSTWEIKIDSVGGPYSQFSFKDEFLSVESLTRVRVLPPWANKYPSMQYVLTISTTSAVGSAH